MSRYSDTPSLHRPSSTADIESEVEDEVDQLDSDSEMDDAEDDPAATSNDARAGQRTPGQSLLPLARMENIIQADGVTGDLALSKEGFFLLSVATEEFIKRMVLAAQETSTTERRPNSVTYPDMAGAVNRCRELNFLVDTIPQPMPLHAALSLRDEHERGSSEPVSTTPWAAADHLEKSLLIEDDTPSHSVTPTNGIERINGESSTRSAPIVKATANGTRTRKTMWQPRVRASDPDPALSWAIAHRQAHEDGECSCSESREVSPLANGHAFSVSRSETRTPYDDHPNVPPSSHQHYQASSTPPHRDNGGSPWTGQFTGPASGFLQGPGAPFGRPPQNAGRTIYSRSDRPD